MRVLGVDLGLRRIGLAVSDPSGTIARPLRTITTTGSVRAAVAAVTAEIARARLEEEGLDGIVVGLPRRLDGTVTDQTSHVQAFVDALQKRVGMPVCVQDERLSSHEAESRLALTRRDWRKRKQELDSAAAAVILQDYLDAHGPGETASQ